MKRYGSGCGRPKNLDNGSSALFYQASLDFYTKYFYFRRVYFDLIVEQKVLIHGLENLEDAVSSFLHVCFVTNMKYPNGAGLVCMLLQRWVAKLDEHGTSASTSKKDQTSKEDKSGRSYKKVFAEYGQTVYQLLRSK